MGKSRMKKNPIKGIFKSKISKIILAIVLILAIIAGILFYRGKQSSGKASESIKTSVVTKQTISSTLSASGTISPKDSYSITSMVDGEVLSADFEEGDEVSEGQVLYQIDSSSIDSKLTNAGNSLERSQKSYDSAVSDYNEAASKLSGNTYKSTQAGYVKNIKVTEGQKISENTEIADLYSDAVMRAYIPFLSDDAAQIPVGSTTILYLSNTLEVLEGTVVSVAALEETNDGGQLTKKVLVEVNNPGGLTSSMAATAEINGFTSTGDGNFQPTKDGTLTASGLSGSATISSVLIHEGDYVNVGTSILSLNSEDVADILDSYEKSMDSAKSSLENAEDSLSSTMDTLDNYTITAPISGTVVTKTVKAGEKVQNGNSSTTLAVIYDLSSVTFQMNIDELDITNVKVGQEVAVTADAFENETYEGVVTNVSMEGTSSNGVTYYPVTVTLYEYGDLLPGMNVDGVITLDEAADAIAVPVDALQRGNVIYVKDSSSKDTENTEESSEQNTDAADSSVPKLDDIKSEGKEDSHSGHSNVPDGFHAVQVTTGIANDEYIEITSGNLSEGDEIYVSQTTVSSSSSEEFGMMGGQGGGMGGGPNGGGQGGGPSGGGPGGGGGPM